MTHFRLFMRRIVCIFVLPGLLLSPSAMPLYANGACTLEGAAYSDKRRLAPTQWTFERKVASYAERARVRGQAHVNELLLNRVNRDPICPDLNRVTRFFTTVKTVCSGTASTGRVTDEQVKSALLVRGVEALGETVQAALCDDLAKIHSWIDHWQSQLDHSVRYFFSQWPHKWFRRVRNPASQEAEVSQHIRALSEIRDCYRRTLGRVVIALDKFNPSSGDATAQYRWMADVFSQVQELCEGSQEVLPTYDSVLNTGFKILHALRTHSRSFNAQIDPHVHGRSERWHLRGAAGVAGLVVGGAFAYNERDKAARLGRGSYEYAKDAANELRQALSADQNAEQTDNARRHRFEQALRDANEGIAAVNRLVVLGPPEPVDSPENHAAQEEARCVRLEEDRRVWQDPEQRAEREQQFVARQDQLRRDYATALDGLRRAMTDEEQAAQVVDGNDVQLVVPQGLGRGEDNVAVQAQIDSLDIGYLNQCLSYALAATGRRGAFKLGDGWNPIPGSHSPAFDFAKAAVIPLSLVLKDASELKLRRVQTCLIGDGDRVLGGLHDAIDVAREVGNDANKMIRPMRVLVALASTLAVGVACGGVGYGIHRLRNWWNKRNQHPAKNALDEITAALLAGERGGADPRLDELDELAVGTLIANARIFRKLGRQLVPEGMRTTFDGDIAQLTSTAGAHLRAKIRWVEYMRFRWGSYLTA